MALFERVKELAKKRGMPISEVERKAGLSENYLYTWKKSENPRQSSITAVAKVLGVSVSYLTNDSDTPEWATEQDKHDLATFIDQNQDSMTFGGERLTEEEKEKLEIAMTQIFWNRRKH